MSNKPAPDDLAAALVGAVQGVTKKWATQRKAEERHAAAVFNRTWRMTSSRDDRVTLRDAAWEVMREA
ncbi:MAG TPA: hypothetical protein VGF39_14010 [Stellaceae bacterium]|jgi:hypothetical protein